MRSKTCFNRAHQDTPRIHQILMNLRWRDYRLRINDWILQFERIWSKLKFMRVSRKRKKKRCLACWISVKVLKRNFERGMIRFLIWKSRFISKTLRLAIWGKWSTSLLRRHRCIKREEMSRRRLSMSLSWRSALRELRWGRLSRLRMIWLLLMRICKRVCSWSNKSLMRRFERFWV